MVEVKRQILRVGDVAQRSGISVAAVHFYERKGLIRSARNGGNQREYEREVLRRIAVIQVAQTLGFTLAEVKELLADLPQGHAPSKAEWRRLAAGWSMQLTQRMRVLKRLKQNLTGCIGCGCLSMARCKLLNKQDVLARKGTGPQRIVG